MSTPHSPSHPSISVPKPCTREVPSVGVFQFLKGQQAARFVLRARASPFEMYLMKEGCSPGSGVQPVC